MARKPIAKQAIAKPKKRKAKVSTKRLDTLWSQMVRGEAKGCCEYCGVAGVQAHHIIGRKNFAVRWDLDNGIALCPTHHKFDRHFSAHGAPTYFSQWLIQFRGERWHEELRQKALKPWHKDKERNLAELTGGKEWA